jgi:predicted dinucleotide-binding enzyme
MKLAFIGIGKVGFALANNLQQKGYEIIIAHDNPNSESVVQALQRNQYFSVLPIQTAIDAAAIIFLAIPFKANKAILKPLSFGGKTLIDCTNPVGSGISHGLQSRQAGAEQVQLWAEDAKVVKAYTIYGYENLENTAFPNSTLRPVMLIAGDDLASKTQVRKLNTALGFETLDTGVLGNALHLEHMTLLWVKMVRAGGHHPHFSWAYLERPQEE